MTDDPTATTTATVTQTSGPPKAPAVVANGTVLIIALVLLALLWHITDLTFASKDIAPAVKAALSDKSFQIGMLIAAFFFGSSVGSRASK